MDCLWFDHIPYKDAGKESNDWHNHRVTDEVKEIQKLHTDDSNGIKDTVA